MAEINWRPSPKFILRRSVIRHITCHWPVGYFLEIGAGTGTMTRVFLDRGFTGICHDISEITRQILKLNLKKYGNQVVVIDHIEKYPDELFDYLFAFEVLEHIQYDLSSLKEWSKKLKSGGSLLVSVPAHEAKYSNEDEFIGHMRRYDKVQLYKLLINAGFTDVNIYNYGFPLGNISSWISRALQLSGRKRSDMSFLDRSIQSGIQRSGSVRKTGIFFNEATLLPFSQIQKFFLQSNLGDGYIATGLKRSAYEHLKQCQQGK